MPAGIGFGEVFEKTGLRFNKKFTSGINKIIRRFCPNLRCVILSLAVG
jgi:hypothetical protein